MGYFDGLVDAGFKTADDGTQLFYPWGFLGKGYILPSEEKKRVIRKFLKLYYMVSLALGIVVMAVANITNGWSYGIPLIIALAVGLFLWWLVTVSRLTRGLQATETRLTLLESYRNMARSMSIVVLWLLEILSLFFTIAGIILIFLGFGAYGTERSIALGLAGIFFFILGSLNSILGGYMIRVKGKQ